MSKASEAEARFNPGPATSPRKRLGFMGHHRYGPQAKRLTRAKFPDWDERHTEGWKEKP